ncbi:carbohydrate ABC transporter permease [Clostridiaceae bacterium OttesenSCG-928-D20]|nr:carbohydrate ABC transporter permease [Clostridiaceae bacterium OttesenSCG-928-D20]
MEKNSGIYNSSRARASLFVSRGFAYLVLILLAFFSLFPFYLLLVNASRAHPDILKGFSISFGSWFSRNFKGMISQPVTPILSGIKNSLIVSGGVAVLSCYFSALTAHAIHSYNFRLKHAAFVFIIGIMIIPTQVSAPGFVQLVSKLKLNNSFIPLIVPAIASPVTVFFMKQYMEGALPLEIVEAARIDGSNEFRTFNLIVLPIMKPALAVQAIITFIGSWNNYFVPALILETDNMKTVPIVIAQLRSADFVKFDMGILYMTIAAAIVPIVIVYFILSKYIVQGVAMGSVKG